MHYASKTCFSFPSAYHYGVSMVEHRLYVGCMAYTWQLKGRNRLDERGVPSLYASSNHTAVLMLLCNALWCSASLSPSVTVSYSLYSSTFFSSHFSFRICHTK